MHRRSRKLPAAWMVALWACLAAGCNSGGGSSPTAPPPPPTGPLVTFSDFQAAIFTPTCSRSGCHSSGSAQAGLVLVAGASYGNLVNVASTERPSLLRVSPNQAEMSYLIHKLRGDNDILGERMPLGGPFLAQRDLDALIAWINRGAPND